MPFRTEPKATQVLVPNPTLRDQTERDHAMPELTGTHLTVPSPKSYKLMSLPHLTRHFLAIAKLAMPCLKSYKLMPLPYRNRPNCTRTNIALHYPTMQQANLT